MQRRLVVSLVLGVLLVLLQLLFLSSGWPIALLTGLVAVVVAFLVLTFSDRYSRR